MSIYEKILSVISIVCFGFCLCLLIVSFDMGDVIIFTASRIVGIGSFIRPNWYQWYSGGGLPVDVTHWMPLPEPPKEDA